jgi:Capsule polysaccharide biosynthesis protein
MPDDYSPFQRFLAESARFWQRAAPTPRPDAPVILVDLMVDHPQYYLMTLVVAKYLQRLSGARLVGFVDNHNHQKAILTAKSFGVEAVHLVNDMAAVALAPDLPDHAARLRRLEGAALRRAVLDLECDGLPIGDLVYDIYLRSNKCATIETCSNELLLDISLGLNTVRFMRGVLDNHPRIEAAVVGHNCYTLYGVLCRLAEARGADVHLASKMRFAFNVQRYSASPPDKRCRMRICPDQFAAAWAGDRDRAAARGQALIAERMTGKTGPRSGKMGGFDAANPVVSVPSLFGRRDDARRDRPMLCIMASTLADAPHANAGSLYDDQYVWLIETLKIAAQMPETDWIVKLHPYTGLYMDRRHVDAVVSRHVAGAPNMRLMPETVNTRSLIGAIDGLITPWGTAGLEFAVLGVPILTAGNTFYSGLGFTIDPRTAADYRAAIATLSAQRQSGEAVTRASVAASMTFDSMLSACTLAADVEALPWRPYDEIALWQETTERLAANTVEDDPLFQRIERYQADAAFSI